MFVSRLREEEEERDDNEDAEDEESEESGEDDALEQIVIVFHLHNSHLIEDAIYLCLRSRDIYVGNVCNYISEDD